jgi:hypothetical protein
MDLITNQTSSDKLPLLGFLKQNDQDFEWYPTTPEMLDCVNSHVNYRFSDRFSDKHPRVSVLDCGAGDGRSLESIANGGDMYAIEKSDRLIKSMSDDIYIVGTDFHQNTIIDKKVEVLFSNPPYSEYQEWSSKVIREANCTVIYLIIPTRWVDSHLIKEALSVRDAEAKVLGTFDFLNAERQARAVVNVLAIDLTNGRSEHRSDREPKIDPFSVWFDEYFAINAEKSNHNQSTQKEFSKQKLSETVNQELVNGRNLIQVLVELYNNEMHHLVENYQAVGKLDYAILKELGVSVSGLQKGLEQKIIGLKSKFWTEFFNNYKQLTSRLTSASREAMLKKLHANMSIDFSEANALAVTIWAIKNANQYFDKQLIKMFESMVDQANVVLYKSNMRTWGNQEWRYCRSGPGPDDLSHYGLELRVVLQRYSAIEGGRYGYSFDYKNGLHKDAHNFLEDLLTIAGNLGFTARSSSLLKQWESNKKQFFTSVDGGDIMQVKAFKNGNIHIKFNQLFIRKMNVEFGRLKGWLKNKVQAANELNIPVEEIEAVFNSNHQIPLSSVPQICCGTAVQ